MPRASRLAGVVWRQLSQAAMNRIRKNSAEHAMAMKATRLSVSHAVSKMASRMSRLRLSP